MGIVAAVLVWYVGPDGRVGSFLESPVYGPFMLVLEIPTGPCTRIVYIYIYTSALTQFLWRYFRASVYNPKGSMCLYSRYLGLKGVRI